MKRKSRGKVGGKTPKKNEKKPNPLQKPYENAVKQLQTLLYNFTSSIVIKIVVSPTSQDLDQLLKKIQSLEELRKLERQNNTMMDVNTVEILYNNPDRIEEIKSLIKPGDRVYLHGPGKVIKKKESSSCIIM